MLRTNVARAALVLALAGTGGCAAASQLAALRQVEFRFDHIGSPMVAGVPLERIGFYSDLSVAEAAQISMALASGEVPMDLTVHVTGLNPESNSVTARLIAMDWSYLVDDREAVAGRLSDPISFAPGTPQDIPLRVRLDLRKVFDERGRDLIEVALALAGHGSSSHRVTFRIAPTVDTPLGPIQYPSPISFDISSKSGR